jgi:membrane-bound lytic murein transglycosylase F
LAAYNLGPGHVYDARELTRKGGGDPNKWIDVKKALPLLGKEPWHRHTRHGYARGATAVHYVQSIRRFYDLLVWLTEEEELRRLALGTSRQRIEGA